MTKKLHDHIFGPLEGLDESFEPLGKLTSPNKLLVEGKTEDDILNLAVGPRSTRKVRIIDDIFAPDIHKDVHSKKHHKNIFE